MHYYEHHLGDYTEATSHLSFVEDAAYSRCIRKYYSTEKPLPGDIKAVQRLVGARTKEEKAAVELVLNEFFELSEEGWRNSRCDQEIARYLDKQAKAARSANARWKIGNSHTECNANAMRTHTERIPNAVPTQCEGNAPNLQSPISEKERALADARAVAGLDVEAFDRWTGYRAKRKPAIKTWSLIAAAEELAGFGARQADVVQHSIANSYQGLFAPKPAINGKKPDGEVWT